MGSRRSILLFSGFLLFSVSRFYVQLELAAAQNSSVEDVIIRVDVGLILDLQSWVGKMSESCIAMALEDFYATHPNYTTRLALHVRDSNNNVVDAAVAALDLLNDVGVQAIIGPQNSEQAKFLVNLGSRAHIPIISFSATSLSLSSMRTPYFIRAAQNDSSQLKAITSIIQAFGWMEVVPVYEDTDYGNEIITYLTQEFQKINARLPYMSSISPLATDRQVLTELRKLMSMKCRVFVVLTSSSLGSRIFMMAKEVGMMSKGYVWIITDELVNLFDVMNSSVIDSMQGVLGAKPYVPNSEELENFSLRWKKNFSGENPHFKRVELSSYGLWAYDTIWALATATEKVGEVNSQLWKAARSISSRNQSSFKDSVSGPELRDEILKTHFKEGLSGEFHLTGWGLDTSTIQIVNVVGKGAREIGFWTPRYGISRVLNVSGNRMYSTSSAYLKAIIWPGESTTVPTNWKPLRIGVPIRHTFRELVMVEKNPSTNTTSYRGLCVEVFQAVTEALPFSIAYEFVPIEAGTYDSLIYQVHLQKLDAVVGDTTITANRSLYVEFSLPYTESGVALITTIKGDERKNAWVFLKPLSVDLWVTSGAAFIFTGFVVWVLEHQINEDFRGRPCQQLGMILWFAFSTLVFAHREKVISNLSKFVVIVWVFVVLVLSSSYTASLSSLLTIQSLTPEVADISDLISRGDYVGHLSGSKLTEYLMELNFDKSKIIGYSSPETYAEALSKGSKNGGVAAVFDEIPYIKLFLAKNCAKYTMVRPIYRAGGFGFGFVFPKGSPLVPYINTAILNVTEGDKISKIEQFWFGRQATCVDQRHSLTLESFGGLFLMAGIASASALSIYLLIFLYKHKHILFASEKPVWERLISIGRHFDKKDHSCCDLRTETNGRSLTGDGGIVVPSHISSSPRISNDTIGSITQEDGRIGISSNNKHHSRR